MTSDRVYRAAQSVDAAVKELQLFSGRQFDPSVVDCFVENLNSIVGEVSPHLLEMTAMA